jgi:hypothetical protein
VYQSCGVSFHDDLTLIRGPDGLERRSGAAAEVKRAVTILRPVLRTNRKEWPSLRSANVVPYDAIWICGCSTWPKVNLLALKWRVFDEVIAKLS